MGEIPDGETVRAVTHALTQDELDKLNLKLWEKFDEKELTEISQADVQSLVKGIFSTDYEVRQVALSRLIRLGVVAANHLVDLLVKNPTDSTMVFEVTYALEEIGKRAVPPLLETLKKIEDFKQPPDLTLLETITDTLDRLNDRSAIPILAQYLTNIKKALQKSEEETKSANKTNGHGTLSQERKTLYNLVRLKIHELLGDFNAPDGLDDLLTLLGDGTKRVHEDIIETLGKVGDQRALAPLIRLYPIEQNISELGGRYIKNTFREIVRRNKISRNHNLFKNLSAEEKATLDKIFPRLRNNH